MKLPLLVFPLSLYISGCFERRIVDIRLGLDIPGARRIRQPSSNTTILPGESDWDAPPAMHDANFSRSSDGREFGTFRNPYTTVASYNFSDEYQSGANCCDVTSIRLSTTSLPPTPIFSSPSKHTTQAPPHTIVHN